MHLGSTPKRFFLACVAATLLATAAPPAAGTTSLRGPLAVGDLFPARRGFLQLGPESVAPIASGEWRLDLLISAANTFAGTQTIEEALEARDRREPVTVDFLRQFDDGSGVLFVDGQDSALRLKVARGLDNGWQIGFELPLLESAEGNLDGVAEGFHDLLGLDQDGRFGLTKDDHLMFISNGNGVEVYIEEAPGSGVGDLTISAKRALTPYRRWQRAFDAALKLPTGDEKRLMSSGSADVALRFLGSRAFGPWHVHGGAGMIYLGHWRTLGTPPQIILSGFAAIELVHRHGGSTVLQLVALESPFQDLGIDRLDSASFQLTLGGRLPITARHWLTLGATENMLHFGSGSDFAFHIGISTALR